MRTRQSRRRPLIAGAGPLAKVPPVAVFLVVVAVFAAGALLGGPAGAALLGLLAAGVAVLLAVTWPALDRGQRMLRVVVLLALAVVAVLQFLH